MTRRAAEFEALLPAEHALLWAMRLWVMGHCRQQDVSARLAATFGDLGAAAVLPWFEGFMWALSRGAVRPIEVLCLCRVEISDDEHALLDAFALLQQDEPQDAQERLVAFLTEPAATVAVRSAEHVAQRALTAGLVLPSQPADAAGRPKPPRVLH